MERVIKYIVLISCIWGLSASYGFAFEDQELKAKSLAAYTMGVLYDLEGKTDEAVAEYEKSANLENTAAVHLRLGADYARLGKLPEAIEALNRVLETDPENIQARYVLALIYNTQKEFDKAALQYEAILKSFTKAEPKNIEIYGLLAQLYYSQKEYDKAISQFEIILSLQSDNVDIMFLLGSLYAELSRTQEAEAILNKAIKIDPEHDGCLNTLGYLYAEEGVKLDEAKELIGRALTIDPKNGAYLDSLGWVYYRQGQYEEALKYLQQADKQMKDPVIHEHLGDVYVKLQKVDEAEKFYRLSLASTPYKEKKKKKIKALESSVPATP